MSQQAGKEGQARANWVNGGQIRLLRLPDSRDRNFSCTARRWGALHEATPAPHTSPFDRLDVDISILEKESDWPVGGWEFTANSICLTRKSAFLGRCSGKGRRDGIDGLDHTTPQTLQHAHSTHVSSTESRLECRVQNWIFPHPLRQSWTFIAARKWQKDGWRSCMLMACAAHDESQPHCGWLGLLSKSRHAVYVRTTFGEYGRSRYVPNLGI